MGKQNSSLKVSRRAGSIVTKTQTSLQYYTSWFSVLNLVHTQTSHRIFHTLQNFSHLRIQKPISHHNYMTSAIPALGDSYSLTELPRIPDLELSARVIVPHSQSSVGISEVIDLGISKLLISSYVLKPTPKLIWSFPLSPNTLVDSMDVKGDLYVVGLTERKKSKLLLIQKVGNESSKTAEIPLNGPASTVKFSEGSSKIYVLLHDGDIQLFNYEQEELSLSKSEILGLPKLTAPKSLEVIYHTVITNHEFQHKNDLLFYVVWSKKQRKFTYRLIALDGPKTFEIYQTSIESSKNQNLLFAYNSSILYAFDTVSKNISSSSLMKPQETIKSFSLAAVLDDDSKLFSLSAPSSERLLLSFKSLMVLINFRFETLLSKHTHKAENQVFLNFSLPVKGDSQTTRNSYALYLNAEEKTKTCKLNLIQVDVGLNLLRESLGKSVHRVDEAKWNGFPLLTGEDLVKENESSIKELEAIFKKLTKASSKKRAEDFDKNAIEFLTSLSSKAPKFTAGSDRVVDAKFIKLILALVFECDEDNSIQILDDAFLPEGSMMYLLTHPLFPHEFANGLLILLSRLNQPRLLKQAIDHCSAISIEELIGELINLTDLTEEMNLEEQDEAQYILSFLRATIDRLVKDYSVSQITSRLLELLNMEFDGNNKKLDRILGVLININTNNSWILVQAVIDVGGLFNWTVPTINRLSKVIDSKVEALTVNSYNLTLTNQAVLGVQQKARKGKKKAPSLVVDNIHELNNQRTQLDAILTISNNTPNRKLLVDEGIELAKQIPTYSREKLIL